jgi:heat shock protein HslJ
MKYLHLIVVFALSACSAPSAHDSASAAAPGSKSTTAAMTNPALLDRYHWVLADATDRKGARIDALFARPERPLQLDFGDGHISVENACNRIGGAYSLQAGRLQVGRLGSTLMACTDPKLAALDGAISSRLERSPAFVLSSGGDAPHLELTTDEGDRLVFHGQPTPETRYGGAGERVFLEVAAQTVPCSHPLIPNKQCLRVREVHYDGNGLKTGTPGEWQMLYQDIEGYTHEPGVRNVLRLKRFKIAHPPADAPAQAYVLDMVVESEIVKP